MYSSSSGLGIRTLSASKIHPTTEESAEKLSASATAAAIDAGLVERFNAGDEGAFVEIVARYRAKIFNLSCGLLRNRADAEEITQDTFIRAYRGLAGFRGDCSLVAWLHRIAVNLSRNHYWYFFRRHRHDMLSLDCALSETNADTFSDIMADTAKDPVQEAAAGEFTSLIVSCMAQLGAGHREILTLRTTLDHSYDEIADILGLNIGTVKSRIARARENLRLLLVASCPEFEAQAAPADWFIPDHSS